MAPKVPSTLDLFASAPARSLGADWPPANRFPLNDDAVTVEATVLADLRASEHPLLVVGYASLDRLIDFVASADACREIRVVFGTEPSPSRAETFSIHPLDLPREMKAYWLERGISVLLSGKLLVCLERLQQGRLNTRYLAGSGRRLHGKLYIGDGAATLGSSNFTDPGLRGQLEANVRFQRHDGARDRGQREEHQRYLETKRIAEELWRLGEDFNARLIELLKELLRLCPWQEAIARASAELLEAQWAQRYLRGEYLPGDAALWPSQRQGIAQALYILKERGSVLVADATGSGKTRTGVHLIGAKLHEIIASNRLRRGKAVLISPPSVTTEWERESAVASVPLAVYSHGALSRASEGADDSMLNNVRRAQILCVDEGHNFLNIKSNRTQQLLRNMADHVALFTATPINRSASDLLRIADMLGADNLDDATLQAFERMLGARSVSRSLSEEEIRLLRIELAKFTVRRTKRVLNQLIDRDPAAYTDAQGRQCRFPRHEAQSYPLREPAADREKASRIRELASELKGLLYFRRDIALPPALRRTGMTEERFLQGRLRGASRLSQYAVMAALRSSRAALLEHLLGTSQAAELAGIAEFTKATKSGEVIAHLGELAGKPPRSRLSIPLPEWLADADAHRAACEEEIRIYGEIAEVAKAMSTHREQAKARKLRELATQFSHILAFDSRPITLACLRQLLGDGDTGPRILLATGDTQSDRTELLQAFSPRSGEAVPAIGLCSDSVAEGVNLQRAQAMVHLDMPSVVRIAEQRSGRIDRLDSPYAVIHAWWPEDAPEFALRSDERFIERYETVDSLLGSNMPLPEGKLDGSATVSAAQAIREYETVGDAWDGIEDAFSPVRSLVSGPHALIPEQTYTDYLGIRARVCSRVSLVTAASPWAFFCISDNGSVPRWILLRHPTAQPDTDLRTICEGLRERLGPQVQDLPGVSKPAEDMLSRFLTRLSEVERSLLSRRKRLALEEMEAVLDAFLASASARRDQAQVEFLRSLLDLLQGPTTAVQPDWEELAARWLDLIRPVWYERLHGRRNRPLLLRDIRDDLIAQEQSLLPKILHEFSGNFPAQRPADERIVACIVGVDVG